MLNISETKESEALKMSKVIKGFFNLGGLKTRDKYQGSWDFTLIDEDKNKNKITMLVFKTIESYRIGKVSISENTKKIRIKIAEQYLEKVQQILQNLLKERPNYNVDLIIDIRSYPSYWDYTIDEAFSAGFI